MLPTRPCRFRFPFQLKYGKGRILKGVQYCGKLTPYKTSIKEVEHLRRLTSLLEVGCFMWDDYPSLRPEF